jgi:hypothetical protein
MAERDFGAKPLTLQAAATQARHLRGGSAGVRGSIAAPRHIKTVAETSRQCQKPPMERGKRAPHQNDRPKQAHVAKIRCVI